MKFQRPGIHNYFYVLGIIQGIAGAIAMLVGIIIIAANNNEVVTGMIVIGSGLAAVLLFPFVVSWGLVVEKLCSISDNTTLLLFIAKKQNRAETEPKKIAEEDLPEI